MHKSNQSEVTEIILFGFPDYHSFIKSALFFVFLLLYCLTVCENVLIIALVATSKHLKSPMYVFIQQLSVSDILLTTIIVPIMLKIVICEGIKMSLAGCITQLYFFASLEAFQCLLLTVMSFDRYLAICIPLRYVSIMSRKLCFKLILVSWLIGLSFVMTGMIVISTLRFHKQNNINHFFCDLEPLLQSSCSDTKSVRIVLLLLTSPVIVSPSIIIITSYVSIAIAILKIVSTEGKQKAFSTCSSHLTVVCMFYGTLISIYVVPNRGQSLAINKILSLLYTVVIPFVNPIIYSLRSKDLKEALFSVKIYKITAEWNTIV